MATEIVPERDNFFEEQNAVRQPAPDHNSVVSKSNEIIEALAKFELSELRLLSFCIAHYDPRPSAQETQKGRRIIARVDDLKEIYAMSTNDAYAIVKQKIKAINQKPYEYVDQETGDQICNFWFTGFRYSTRKGEFIFGINPDMEPHLLGLAGNFTRWRLGNVYQFKSANTWKLYENLAQWRTAGRWSVSLEELRHRLGVGGLYPKWAIFNRDVISKAKKEINDVSDLQIEYTQEKRGKKVVGLTFHIDKKIDPEIINIAPTEEQLYKALLKYGTSAKTALDYAKKIVKAGKTDEILAKLPRWSDDAKKKKIPAAKYILGSIKQLHTDCKCGNLPKRKFLKNQLNNKTDLIQSKKKRFIASLIT